MSTIVNRRQPTDQQRLLLHAALLAGEQALTAWRAWHLTADLDHLPPGGFALLPLLAYNLQPQGINDDLLNKCQGIYRRTWTQNQLHLQSVSTLLRSIQDAGLTPVLTGDLPLALLYYPTQGLYAINQLQLWTPAAQAAAMQRQLTQAGWQRQQTKQDWLYRLGVASPTHRFRRQGEDLVLQWRTLTVSEEASLSALRQNSQPLTINGVVATSVNPTDLLLWVCSRGIVDFWVYGTVQWLADALMVLRSSIDEIDWPYLVEQATQQAVALRLSSALQGLQEWVDAPIPPSVRQAVAGLSVQPFEGWEARLCQRFPSKAGKLISLWSERQRTSW